MQVRRRKDTGYYETDFSVRISPTRHKRVRKACGTKILSEAKQFAARLYEQLIAEIEAIKNPVYDWQSAVVRFLKENQLANPLYKKDDATRLHRFSEFWGNVALDSVTAKLISEASYAFLAAGLQPATVNRNLVPLRTLLRRAEHEWQWVKKAPQIKMHKIKASSFRFATKEEAARIIAALESVAPYLAPMAIFAVNTGIRKSNLIKLKWSQVDLERKWMWLRAEETKGGVSFGVPLCDAAVGVLIQARGKHPTFVFTYEGQPLYGIQTKTWYKALKLAGVEGFRWHDWRHTFASWHIQAGTPLSELQKLGAWKSLKMVQHYAHLAPENLAQAARNVNFSAALPDNVIPLKREA